MSQSADDRLATEPRLVQLPGILFDKVFINM